MMLTTDELYLLKSLALQQHEEFSDGLNVLIGSDKSLYKAFGQSPRTKYLNAENFYLTSKERLTYIMGFIDALAWATRNGHLNISSFPIDPKDFEDPEETPEEVDEYYEERYEGLSPEERAELEACDKEDKELWEAYVAETIKENEIMQKLITCFMTREY